MTPKTPLSPPSHPTVALLHHTPPALPVGQQQAAARMNAEGDILLVLAPRGTERQQDTET